MSGFFFARSQMAMSLAFHIIFAALGIGMPLLMAIAEGMYLRTGQPVYLELSKRWSRGTAILFAVGAGSGTVLSFELGLLWPGFMEKAGAIIGMPFSLGRLRLFHRSHFYRYVSVWLEPPVSASALALKNNCGGQRNLLGDFRRDGQCVDERARRLQVR